MFKIIIEEKMKPYLGKAINFDFNTFMLKEKILRDFRVMLTFLFVFAVPFNVLFGWKGFANNLWDLQNPVIIVVIILTPIILILTSIIPSITKKWREVVLYLLLFTSVGLYGLLCGLQLTGDTQGGLLATFVGLGIGIGIILLIIFFAWLTQFVILWFIYDKISLEFCWALGSAESLVRAMGGLKLAVKNNPSKIFSAFILSVAILYFNQIPKHFEQDVLKREKYLKNYLQLDDENLSINIQKKLVINKSEYDFGKIKALINELMEVAITSKNHKKAYTCTTPDIKQLVTTVKPEVLIDSLVKAATTRDEQQTKPVPKVAPKPMPQKTLTDPFADVFAMNLPKQKLDLPSQRDRMKIMLKESEEIINEALEMEFLRKRIFSEKQLLQTLKESKEYKIRMTAAYKLETIASKEAIQALIKVMEEESKINMPCIGDKQEDFEKQPNTREEENENEGNCQLSAKAVKVLGNIGKMLGSYGLQGFDSDKFPDAIKKMNKEMRLAQKDLIKKTLLAVLEKSKHARIRWHIAEALGKLCGKESEIVLISTMKNDEMETVREYSAEALGRCFASSALLPLIECFNMEQEEMAQEAMIEAIAIIGKSIVSISKRHKSQEQNLKTLFGEAIPKLKAIVNEEEDWQKKAWVIWCLGRLGTKEIVPFLEEILNSEDEDEIIKNAAQNAIIDAEKGDVANLLIEGLLSGEINLD